VLRCNTFLHGSVEVAPGINDISWFDERAAPLSQDNWNDAEARLLTLRRAAVAEDGATSVLTLMLNATAEDRSFTLPAPGTATRLIDSADPAAPEQKCSKEVNVSAHSAILLLSTIARDAPPPAPRP
jgi:isoamylase